MVKKSEPLIGIMIIFCLLISLGFVVAIDCWQYGGWQGYTDDTECVAHGCVWKTQAEDAWCDNVYGCCMMNECWQHDGTNQSYCENTTLTGLNCTWDPYMTIWYPNGSQGPTGGCMNDYSSDGGGDWGGMSDGCWQYDGDKGQCTSSANAQSCNWVANDQNQNPWCWIKNLLDAQMENSLATATDIGCCDMKGCWTYDGNETMCVNNTAFFGLCTWQSKENDPWCPNDVGCCMTKWCGEIGDSTNCSKMQTDLFMPCKWEDSVCTDGGGSGGFMAFNDTDSCMSKGGWWNSSGDCQMPTSDGGGGFMFGGDAHCWFASGQLDVCKNLTGCIYCESGTGPNGVDNLSNNNICAYRWIGDCEGRDSWGPKITQANNTDNLKCEYIQIRGACNYGPLPNCVWNSSVNLTGPYCASGTNSVTKSTAPVSFCEHPTSINNYTLCKKLWEEYMMPCKWGNASSNKTLSDNCTFNPSAVFGGGGGADSTEKEYESVLSESMCVAAGGTWKKEYYLEDGNLKQDKWCEKGAMFDFSTVTAFANKGNCNMDCWACEFQSNGTTWLNAANASYVCNNSALGYCRWTDDSNAPNGYGFCDYPEEMSYGAGDCQSSCKDCGLMQSAYTSCVYSAAGCKWVNNTDATAILSTGTCVDQSKKTCTDDCFSCYDFNSCNASSVNCQWDNMNSICKPFAFDGEICFDGMDNDGDTMADCGDPDCNFDTSCGGSSFADCAQYSFDNFKYSSVTAAVADCIDAVAFGTSNCTWINFTWEDIGHCGMPGEDCWLYDNNLTLCGLTAGCTNTSTQSFNNFCDINMTKQSGFDCWQYNTEATCTEAIDSTNATLNCTWRTSEYSGSSGGWCEYWLFAGCNSKTNGTACRADGNCTWETDLMDPTIGWCMAGCFNHTLNSSQCIEGNRSNICEWRDTSTSVCMPSTFDMMGGGSGAKTGCPQYDGNYTACIYNNYTCVWKNDTNIDNNASGGGDVDGWCYNKGNYEMNGDMKGEMIFLGMDTGNVMGAAEPGVFGWADIKGFGMRVSDKAYGFGAGIHNLTDGAVCNGYNLNFAEIQDEPSIGSGLNITKIIWYLDTDGNSSVNSHCYATDSNGASCTNQNPTERSLCGYEFYLEYIVKNNSNTGGIEATKKLYQCILNSTGWQWVPTNVFVTDNKKFTCYDSGMGAVFVSVEKEAIENFALFNITAPIRVFAVSFKGSGSGDGADEVGPGYYTPGTVDFGFVDCSNPDIKDPKCKSFQKFGFQAFEDCKNGVDDDSDGRADCADDQCAYMPACATGNAFNWSSMTNDNKAPSVIFSKIDKMADAAIVVFDTDEPANGSLMFYRNSSTCTTINATLNDLGDALWTYDDYKSFHKVVLDLDSLGYALTNGTFYYYKAKVCDPFNNCGTSACLNFTTRKENKNFILRLDVPANFTVDIPALSYSGNFTYSNQSLLGDTTYDIGIKTNSSQTKNMNITVNYSDLSIKFVGVDVYKPKTLNLDSAFIVDTTNNNLGMNSSSKAWQMLVNDLGLGGAGDYIELDIPVAYSSSNILNWSDDSLMNGTDVTDYASCRDGGNSHTKCKIPTSLGFSIYNIVVPTSSSSDPSSSGGGGGGSVASNDTNATEEEDFVMRDEGIDKGSVGVGEDKEKVKDVVMKKIPTWVWWTAGIVVVLVVIGIGWKILRKGKSSNVKTSRKTTKAMCFIFSVV